MTVAGAGLLDGINPCAFATIIFFISYMNLVGRRRKEMLIAGGAFALAVFVTYLLLGLGMLSFMNYLKRFSGVTTCVYLIAAMLTFGLAGLSLYDAVKAKQGKTKDILLQLPLALKQRIHKVIREQTRTSGIIFGAIVIGFVISALELVCTGQVYLPTLTFVSGIDEIRSIAIAYLLLYNFMFIVPLLVVFGCVYWGITSAQLGGVLQRHLVTVKVAISALLFGLGTWLVLLYDIYNSAYNRTRFAITVLYLPTLTFVSGIDEIRSIAIAYLLLYNLMFIAAELLVACSDVSSGCAGEFTYNSVAFYKMRHLVTVKVAHKEGYRPICCSFLDFNTSLARQRG